MFEIVDNCSIIVIFVIYNMLVDIKMGGKKDDGLIYERFSTIC